MHDILEDLLPRWEAGESVGLATVVRTFRSAPREAGAAMLVAGSGEVIGSVSGGCVEGAVYELAQEVRASGVAATARYGVSDDDAFSVGLTCGGSLDVFVERVDRDSFPELGDVADDVRAGRPVAVATVVRHTGAAQVGRRLVIRPEAADAPLRGSLGSVRLDEVVAEEARGLLAAGQSQVIELGVQGQRRGRGMEVFVASFAPPPRLFVFGAIDFAASMAELGKFLGYHVTVCDARPVFATTTRFPRADEVIIDWPHRYLAAEVAGGRVDGRSVVCLLTHDPKFDVPLLEVALRLPESVYVGAMGSRRTHDERMARLREKGLTDQELRRLSSPIGLDLGARTCPETAVSIAAEIIAARWGGSGIRLGSLAGSIHQGSTRNPRTATDPEQRAG